MLKIPITGKPLKPCPFCGGNNMSLFEECVDFMNFKDCIYTIECNRCNAKIKRYSITGAKRAWNRREGERVKMPKQKSGEWKALGFQQGYAFCTCSNCDKTMRLYRDSKNEFCCIKDIREKVIACMYCGASMSANDRQVTSKLNSEIEKSKSEIVPDYRDGWRKRGEAE